MTDLENLCQRYEQLTLKLLAEIRAAFDAAEVPNMQVFISASGRVASGDLKLEYTISDTDYDGAKAKGGTLYPVLVECLRRRGFDRRHKPLAIGYDSTVKMDEEG